MRVKLRGKILGLAFLAALVPLVATLVTIQSQRAKVDERVTHELDKLTEASLSRIAHDVYDMCQIAHLATDPESGQLDPAILAELRQSIMDIRVGKDGYVYVIGANDDNLGEYVISLDGKSDGTNIWESTDNDGKKFVQEIVKAATTAPEGEVVMQEYFWLNQGDTHARKKLAAVAYFEPWGWVIGASAYEDDFLTARDAVSTTLTSIITMTGIIGFVILLIVTTVAILVSQNIVKPIKLITEGARLLALGDINLTGMDRDETGKINKRYDELGDIGRAFTDLIENQSGKAQAANEIAQGNVDADIFVASEDDVLGKAMVTMRTSLQDVIKVMNETYVQQKAGDIEYFADLEGFQGAYRELAENYNGGLKLHIDAILGMLDILGQYSEGNFEKEMPKLPGKQIIATEIINKLRDNLSGLINEMRTLVENALAGDLASRADAGKFKGGYQEVVTGVNDTLDAVVKPVQEASAVLEKMAKGDLTDQVKGDYKGDHATIKNALNDTLKSLNVLLEQVNVAVEQVNSGATQVSSASQSLSQGATEQASSLEEVSSSMTEVGSQTKMNAENALQANQLAESAKNAANDGNGYMKQLLEAMTEINDQSAEVQKIVKAIDEIAFQTNLLALNAAVEAARAGVHGKGFAVVAEEVRNLAQRSAKAAKETTDLIEGNVAAVTNGSKISDQTAKALQDILEGSTKVTDLVNEIASASKEQTEAVDQIAEALGQIDQVTQSNTASAEESAAASEELAGQATNLSQMIASFKLAKNSGSLARNQQPLGDNGGTAKKAERRSPEAPKLSPAKQSGGAAAAVAPDEIIQLDDADFGEF